MSKTLIAVVQLNSRDNKRENLDDMAKWTREAAKLGAKAVFMPEYASYLADEGRQQNAETLDGESVSLFRELARENGVLFHSGSILESIPGNDRCYNTSVVVDAKGDVVAVYRKIHLFDITVGGVDFRESRTIAPGEEAVLCPTEFGLMGLSICYDMRFPALFQHLAAKGATVLAIPAAFTLLTGMAHWETLLRARAIENLAYVVASAQCGIHPNNKACYGHSLVIDPWGTVVSRASDGPGLTLALVDSEAPAAARAKIPCLSHQRPFK